MIPPGLLERLAQLRRRERLLRLTWGAARLATLAAAVVFVGCLVDLIWDRSEDTPVRVREALLWTTGVVAALGGIAWLVVPQLRRLSDDRLALWVETKHPTFRNRLISAVQLNRPRADRQGMSVELIGVMTREAEVHAETVAFPRVADHDRLRRSLILLSPVVLLAVGLFAWRPELASALLARHFLADVDIPHRTKIAPIDLAAVYPAGEPIPLRFAISGEGFDDTTVGTVVATSADGVVDRYPLKHLRSGDAAVFGVDLAPASDDLAVAVRLGDGRLRKPLAIRVVPRPAVVDQSAWNVLPEYVGLRPSGRRYEQPQSRGDILGIPGSAGRIAFTTQKPIAQAVVETLALVGVKTVDSKPADDPGEESVARTIPCEIEPSGTAAGVTFDLEPNETAYRIVVTDEYGLKNAYPPRRGVRVVPEEAPTIVLLKDYFTPNRIGTKESLEDFVIEGMPVPVGGVLRAPYVAEGPYGLGQAWLLYKVVKQTESGNDVVPDAPWKKLLLPEVVGSKATGAFDPRRGVFENTPDDKGVGFHAQPSPAPELRLGRTLGGGRVHFQTDGIPDGVGGKIQLQAGDKIEYCVEIYADPASDPKRPFARSETRVQTIGTYESLGRWIQDVFQEERRLRALDSRQRTVFADP